MNLSFPLTPEIIRAAVQEVIAEIQAETGWPLQRELVDVEIVLGDAPEYHESFGIVRDTNKLIFGRWLDELESEITRFDLLEFIITRESFYFFIEDQYLQEVYNFLISVILNLLSLILLNQKYKDRSNEIKNTRFIARYIVTNEPLKKEIEEVYLKIFSFSNSVINQKVSYKILLDTFFFFIKDITPMELDKKEIIFDIVRYFSNSPEEIAFPLSLSKSEEKVLNSLVELGFSGTAPNISERVNLESSFVSRILSRINSRFFTSFVVERNFERMGLFYYLFYLRFENDDLENFKEIYSYALKQKYVSEIYEGLSHSFKYIYFIVKCPHIFAENLSNQLSNFLSKGKIQSYEFKLIKRRSFRTTTIPKDIPPSLEQYKKMLSAENDCTKIILWDDQKFKNKNRFDFNAEEKELLHFISFIRSKSISNPRVFRLWFNKFIEVANEIGLDIKNENVLVKYLTKIQTAAIKKDLIDFRLVLVITEYADVDFLVISISNEFKSEIIEKIFVFSWISILESFDKVFVVILGVPFDHEITKIISEILEKQSLPFEIFSVKFKISQFVDYSKLFDYKEKKWLL